MPSLAAIEKFAEEAIIYEVANCPLRVVRVEIHREIKPR